MEKLLGEILVNSGIITVKTLERALTRQQGTGKRLGTVLEEMGVVTQEELTESLAKQSGLDTVKGLLASSGFSAELIGLVPEEIAVSRLVFPLNLQAGVLTLAVSDPFDTETRELLERLNSLKIAPVLATRDEISNALHLHYLQGETDDNAPRKILVVDDSSEVTSDIAQALRMEGYEVQTANDGVDGLAIAFAGKPDMILCGASMPRMDGYALMRAVKANPATAGTPMILLTSKSSPEEKHRALKSGFHDFIAKPMMSVRVVSRVKRAFDIVRQAPKRQPARAL